MSWDVCVMKLDRQYQSSEEMDDDVKPLPLGSTVDVHRAVAEFFPDVDWSDAAWGMWTSPFGSIDFNLGNDEPVESVMLHVRASNEVVPMIISMCRERGWSGLDCSTGELLESSDDPTAGIEGWRTLRDKSL